MCIMVIPQGEEKEKGNKWYHTEERKESSIMSLLWTLILWYLFNTEVLLSQNFNLGLLDCKVSVFLSLSHCLNCDLVLTKSFCIERCVQGIHGIMCKLCVYMCIFFVHSRRHDLKWFSKFKNHWAKTSGLKAWELVFIQFCSRDQMLTQEYTLKVY